MELKGWAEVVKVFLEKHLIPTVVGVIVALVAYVLIPKDVTVVVVLGKLLFLILVWAVVFITIQLILFLSKKRKKARIKKANDEYYRKQDEKEAERQLKQLWNYIDSLSPQDKATIKKFLETENMPIEETASAYHSEDSLLGSELVQSTVVEAPSSRVDLGSTGYSIDYGFPVGGRRLYRLKDKYYYLLKYGYEKYGKINNFE